MTNLEPAAAPPQTEMEKLQEELHMMKTAGIIEVACRNPSVFEFVKHWEGRAISAEARAEALQAEVSLLAAQVAQNPDLPASGAHIERHRQRKG